MHGQRDHFGELRGDRAVVGELSRTPSGLRSADPDEKRS